MSHPPVTTNILLGTLISGFFIILLGCSFFILVRIFLKQALQPEISKREEIEYEIAEKNNYLIKY